MITLASFTLRELEYAVTVARLRHFGRAAQLCGVSQPALSEQIRKLEAMLGLSLFERRSKSVTVTHRGLPIIAQAERILAEARGLIDLALGAGAPFSGPLELGSIQTLGPYYLPRVLRQARQAFPDLALRLTEGQTDPLIASLRTGALDALLLALPIPGPGLTAEGLFFEPFVVVCPRLHPLAELTRLEMIDLSADDLILLEEGHCLRDQALSLCGGAAPRARHAASVETLWHMIAAGEGFSLLPALSLQGRSMLKAMVRQLAAPIPEAGRTIALVWRTTDPRAADFHALAEVLRAELPAEVQALG
jgi:LysR family hydrogen peroxide-inducible transcriptional activator